MPRTTTLECPGCPPLRALTFDELGLIKVTEARSKQGGVPKMVERWGDPDASKCVLAASMDDRKFDPLLAVARKNGTIEVLNPLNGDLHFSVSNVSENGVQPVEDAVSGLHLFAKQNLELTSRSCTLLTCTMKGNASIRSYEVTKSAADVTSTGSSRTWNVCAGGDILCSKVDGSESYSLFGGKRVEMNVWDLENCAKIWTAKSPPKNSLGIFTPTWFTSATYLSKDDHRKFVAGTNSHEVRLYDISAQRRPVITVNFRETPIKAVAEDLDGYTIYIGNGSGDLASVDMRTGKLLGCFLGKCSGSIRSIARHPEFPVIASCGLDSYLRVWNVKTRELLSAVFLKQHLTNVLFDSNFADEETKVTLPAADQLHEEEHIAPGTPCEDDGETVPVKKKKSREKKRSKKEAKAESGNKEVSEENGGKKSKSKKSSKRLKRENLDDEL
ncbi:putative transcription factor WD40-like family [Rosa chinensis]|uniref:Putative transcription factor WD40-like family n=1 Tax=Rosa chinensis TaxID=74649 RepID=A0A2P6P537_ROSCH|nr:WD repeat-containing protein DDB_G0290555 [Rosa chinensis]PRQ17031.1 putative transcription factor WD40-like family [Rosa chinensis]